MGGLTASGGGTGDDVHGRSILEDLRLAEAAVAVLSEVEEEQAEPEEGDGLDTTTSYQ
jgi:hypothetical protein